MKEDKPWILQKPGVLLRRGNVDTGMCAGECHVKVEAEIGVMQPQGRDYLKPPEDERGKERFSLRAF